MKACVICFLGSNCDIEAVQALKNEGFSVKEIFYKDGITEKFDLIVIPGGFSYGDYLRSGAVAGKSKIMEDVRKAANAGVKVVGICNGFQILTEARMLDGVLLTNNHGLFSCKNIHLRSSQKLVNAGLSNVFACQIAHRDGRYFNEPDKISEMRSKEMIAFEYSSCSGDVSLEFNPNGSTDNIAGIIGGPFKNILGLMPHPERIINPQMKFFTSFVSN